jgi:hypothetical protein
VDEQAFRDFRTKRIDLSKRDTKGKKKEEDLGPLFRLGDLKAESGIVPAAYTLRVLGRPDAARSASARATNQLIAEARQATEPGPGAAVSNVRKWNRLIAGAANYGAGLKIIKGMRAGQVEPDVVSFNTLMNLAPNYGTAEKWFERMQAKGVEPSVVSFTTLMNLAADYGTAEKWFERMQAKGVEPDVISFTTLMNLAPSFSQASVLIEQMRDRGLTVDRRHYCTALSRDLCGVSVEEIVAWYRKQGQVRAEPIEAAVSKLRRQGRGEDAIRLAREYPDLPASRKVLVNREDGADARGTKGGKCGR